ncbi:MAG: hypothetical protein GEU97_13995 [Actinophytocola sp.]|nr:hypothetical protein [Actinophytocola sp.]
MTPGQLAANRDRPGGGNVGHGVGSGGHGGGSGGHGGGSGGHGARRGRLGACRCSRWRKRGRSCTSSGR